MSTYVDIAFLVERTSEIYTILRYSENGGYAASMYQAEQLDKARRHWKKELFKQRKKPTVLPRLQQLENVLKEHPDGRWEYVMRKKLCVYTDNGLVCEI